MQLVEKHDVKRGDKFFKECDSITFRTKNLYNVANYTSRQHFFEHEHLLNYNALDKILNKENADYKALPAKVAQQVLRCYDRNCKATFAARKSKNVKHKVSLPKYLHKKRGRFVATYVQQALSKTWLRKRQVALSQTSIRFKTKCDPASINQVRIVPRYGHYVIEVVYTVPDVQEKPFSGTVAGGDIGVNNLLTVGFNSGKRFIINGKPVKSINQYYNKKLAMLKSDAEKHKLKTTHRMEALARKRDNKIKDYLHKASAYAVGQLVSHGATDFTVGHNKGWKLEVNMGKRNNQNFVDIPFNTLINMLEYKCQRQGIRFSTVNESHTSKCSFIDMEEICHHDQYLGKRVKRGLFRSKDGKLINADLNGALNIMRRAKVAGEVQYSVEACSTPVVSTIKYK